MIHIIIFIIIIIINIFIIIIYLLNIKYTLIIIQKMVQIFTPLQGFLNSIVYFWYLVIERLIIFKKKSYPKNLSDLTTHYLHEKNLDVLKLDKRLSDSFYNTKDITETIISNYYSPPSSEVSSYCEDYRKENNKNDNNIKYINKHDNINFINITDYPNFNIKYNIDSTIYLYY